MSVSSTPPSERRKDLGDAQRQVSDLDEAEVAPASKLDGALMLILPFACCLLPFGLAVLSFFAAHIGGWSPLHRHLLEGIAVVALVYAWVRIYRPKQFCGPTESGGAPRSRFAHKVLFWVIAAGLFDVLGPSMI